MKTTYKKLPKSQASVQVTMPQTKIQSHVDTTITKLGSNIEVKGFRKGKAPKNMLVDKIGIGRIQQGALDLAMQEGYLVAIQEHKFSPISQPAVALKKFNLKSDGQVDGDLEFELTVDLMPDIELGDYTKLKLPAKNIKEIEAKIEIADSEIEKVLDHLQKQKSKMEDVTRPVENGDWTEVTFAGTIDKISQEKLGSKNHPLVIGSNSMIPGFEDEIIGMKTDQPKTFKIKFPKEYFAKDLAGKEAEFTVTVHKIKKIILSKLDDAFAKEYGHDTLTKLKKAISDQLVDEKKVQKENQIDSLILGEAKKLMKVEVPEGLVTQEIHRMIDRSKESIEKQGVDFEQYLQSIKKTHDDLHSEYKDQAKANIEVGFLLGEIIKREKLDSNDKQAPTKALDILKKHTLPKTEETKTDKTKKK